MRPVYKYKLRYHVFFYHRLSFCLGSVNAQTQTVNFMKHLAFKSVASLQSIMQTIKQLW